MPIIVRRALVVLALVAVAVSACSRKKQGEAAATPGTYPAPRYPRYLVKPNPEQLIEAARVAVRQTAGFSPLGKVDSGKTVYVLFQWNQDPATWDAIKKAWAERGVEAKSFGNWDVLGMTKEAHDDYVANNALYGREGWEELGSFEPQYLDFFPEDVKKQFKPAMSSTIIRRNLEQYLNKHPEIERFFGGNGGGIFWERAAGKKNAGKFLGNWLYDSPFDLVGKTAEFPADVWNMVDDKILKPIGHTSEGTLTDPEGTKLHWTLTPGQARAWAEHSQPSNHLNLYPSPVQSTYVEGVLRSSANHVGYYPTMTVTLDNHGQIAKVEGGGKTGDLFRMLVDHPTMRNATFPSSPVPGYWFLSQDGFATNPKFVRDMARLVRGSSSFGNLSERQRAGVQHMAFAPPVGFDNLKPEDIEYAKKNNLPIALGTGQGHTMHMHVYFPTIRWKMADTGEWITIADRGQVKAFDDPELRALAAKYGDPSLVFRYEWIPSVPGVNAPGDQGRDYSADPWQWIVTEWQRIQNGTYDGYVDDYKLQGAAVALNQ